MPRTVRRRNRNWLRVCCSVKSYTPERPSPKSRVAIVVVVGCGSSSSVQPVRLSGLTNGAVNRLARTETGPRPAPSRPRISDTAWYCWVEETCTWVGVPRAPLATTAARAACEGIIRYCSATWTSPEAPTADQSARRPSRSGAGGVSASTGTPRSTASAMKPGVTDHGVAVSTKSGRTSRRHASRDVKDGTSSGRGVRTTTPPHGPCPVRAPRRGTSAPANRCRSTRTWSRGNPNVQSRPRATEAARKPDQLPEAPMESSSPIRSSTWPAAFRVAASQVPVSSTGVFQR